MHEWTTGAPTTAEKRRTQRRKPLNSLRYMDFLSRLQSIPDCWYSDEGRDVFAKAVAVLLEDNPHILPDIESSHHPDQVTMAIIPKHGIVLARFNEELLAVRPTLSCTRYAIDDAFNDKQPNGYRIFSYPGGFPEELEDFITSDHQGYSFNFDHDNPLMYIAADVQGFITSNTSWGEDLDQALSPRVSLPLPVGSRRTS